MFLFESRPPFRTTEPKWFAILRFFIAIIFSFALIFYAWNSFGEFVLSINEPGLYISEINETFAYPEFRICPKTLSNYNDNDSLNIHNLYRDISESYSYNDENFHEFQTPIYKDIRKGNYYLISNDSNCRKLTPPNKEASTLRSPFAFLFIITLNDSSVYNYFEIEFKSINISSSKDHNSAKTLRPNQYYITRGQYVIYEFLIKEKTSYSSHLIGWLGLKANIDATFLEIEEKELALPPNVSYTVLELKPKYDFIIHEQQKFQINITKIISNIGGFYGAISGIFVLFFGASKLSPWGICQKYICWWTYRRSFKRSLARRYVSRAGIPLAEDPRELPRGASLQDRIAVLEHLLKEYYLDAYYLEKLRVTRERYLDIRNKNLEAVKLLGDEIGDDLTDGVGLERLEEGSTS
ncbi:unnamed protein product [Rhizophagus irregularis]|uniref:Uncharacterized protein n=1 Tax=Rhizophagus irregularis TaxID=588596 RepID=A0A2I1H7P1_9GLOM|nr:hypothetical protein RhiirA4_448190 [Rhizophagus irregularis]CAB4421577.1 unnamed protein product [Rhizophagus irregularis]CAB4430943.1 unnamed protein product [Rhizophagus irregularis]